MTLVFIMYNIHDSLNPINQVSRVQCVWKNICYINICSWSPRLQTCLEPNLFRFIINALFVLTFNFFQKHFFRKLSYFPYLVPILKWVKKLSLNFPYLVSCEIYIFSYLVLREIELFSGIFFFLWKTSLSHTKLNKENKNISRETK